MVLFLHKTVSVGAVFRRSSVVPQWFGYQGRKIAIKEITYSWKEKRGESMFLHFVVTDGINLYDLSFQPEQLSWHLEAVEDT